MTCTRNMLAVIPRGVWDKSCTRTVEPDDVIPPKRPAQIRELTMVPGTVISAAARKSRSP